MSRELTDDQKAFFKDLAERRKARNIIRGTLSLALDRKAIEAFETFWGSWVEAFGKEEATDYLIEAMCEEHHLLRRRLEYKVEAQRRGEIDRKPKRSRRNQGRAQSR